MQAEDSTPVYTISVAAQLAELHPQTLRQYDRLGSCVHSGSTGEIVCIQRLMWNDCGRSPNSLPRESASSASSGCWNSRQNSSVCAITSMSSFAKSSPPHSCCGIRVDVDAHKT